MGSRLTQPATAVTKMTLKQVITLERHKDSVFTWSMAYAPDGKRMISVSSDETIAIRQWDLQAGKEIEEVREIIQERNLPLVKVSRDGRWVMTRTSGGDEEHKELKAYEVETGIVKTFQAPRMTICIDISTDGKLLASGSFDRTVLIWGIDTGEVAAGPFKIDVDPGVIRFSPDSKKLAVESAVGKCLEVWDVQTQKLDARVGKKGYGHVTRAPILWTKKGTILAVFNFDFNDDDSKPTTIYEFDALTLETVGDPFEGHTDSIHQLALSFDGTLLSGSSFDTTIKLWSLEPRQLLASFHLQHETGPNDLIFSPDTRQIAYWADHKIFIYNTPPDILASTRSAPDAQVTVCAPDNSAHNNLLNSGAARRRANVRRNPAASPMISLPPRPLQPLHTRGLEQPVFFRHLRNLLSFSSHFNAVPPVGNGQPCDPLDIPATSSRIHDHTPAARTTQGHSHSDPREHGLVSPLLLQSQQTQPEDARLRRSNGVKQFLQQHLSFRRSGPTNDTQVLEAEVAPGRKFTRLAVVNLPEYKKVGDTRRLPREQQQPGVSQDTTGSDPSSDSSDRDSLPDVHWCKAFFCYCSCWSHGRLRVPPRWHLELVDETGQDCTTSIGGSANGRS